ncbi:MAG: ABC transporter permease [Pseudomonadota bacterium]|nr:ABC transporter permease [Pseudomonadota bacterium]MEC8977658.1 ABC transporter permease [Pseudomonadota bacterium]
MKRSLTTLAGSIGHFFCYLFKNILCGFPKRYIEAYNCLMQIFFSGVLSSFIIIPSACFIGGVLALQGHYILSMFGSETQLGQLITLSTFRELGPVISALLYTGRTGSSITSEIAIMELSEQIKALEAMEIPTKSYILFPRFISGIISLPLLTILFNTFAIIGGHIIAIYWLQIDAGLFWIDIRKNVTFNIDLAPGLFKSLIFSIIIHSIALYKGTFANKSASGVAQATTETVVTSSLAILIADFFLTALMMRIWI